MRSFRILVLFTSCIPLAATARQGETKKFSNPVTESVRQIVTRQAKNMVAAVEEMPADKFSYHPTPAQMTFAHLVAHMVDSNDFLCSRISGASKKEGPKASDTDSKDKLVVALKSSFDYCTRALAKVDDSVLGDSVQMFGGRSVPRAMPMIALTNDFADHYGMAAMYLRLNGLLPPTAQAQKKD